MLRWDDPEVTTATGTLTKDQRTTIRARREREREGITMLEYEERLRLARLDARWLRRALILIIPTGLADRLSPVSA